MKHQLIENLEPRVLFSIFDPSAPRGYTLGNPGSADAKPADFLIHNHALLFSANDGNGSRELWQLPLD